ncbi:unnamed protein product [Choristocarpus tenellus]
MSTQVVKQSPASKKRSREALAGAACLGRKGLEGHSSSALIKGFSKAVEKSYFRLTSAPDPANVRPPNILWKSVKHVKQHWASNEDYDFACDQLKAIRQDLTVQGIEDQLTVDVYQTHGRIALEHGDMNEYTQCQSRLRELSLRGVEVAKDEFTAYRILYSLYRHNFREVNSTMAVLTPLEKKGEAVKHALEVVSACHASNYHSFFKLYNDAPNMSGYLMDYLVQRFRKNGIKAMVKAYSPSLPVRFIQEELAFADDGEVVRFLASMKAKLKPQEEEGGLLLDTKATRAAWARDSFEL